LELKDERENEEVRVERIKEYKRVVDEEWKILYEKMDLIKKSGEKVVI
jgi:T-complex protein 1 subunit eta